MCLSAAFLSNRSLPLQHLGRFGCVRSRLVFGYCLKFCEIKCRVSNLSAANIQNTRYISVYSGWHSISLFVYRWFDYCYCGKQSNDTKVNPKKSKEWAKIIAVWWIHFIVYRRIVVRPILSIGSNSLWLRLDLSRSAMPPRFYFGSYGWLQLQVSLVCTFYLPSKHKSYARKSVETDRDGSRCNESEFGKTSQSYCTENNDEMWWVHSIVYQQIVIRLVSSIASKSLLLPLHPSRSFLVFFSRFTQHYFCTYGRLRLHVPLALPYNFSTGTCMSTQFYLVSMARAMETIVHLRSISSNTDIWGYVSPWHFEHSHTSSHSDDSCQDQLL